MFIHYSRATYGDHGEIMYIPVPVRCPRSGGTLLAPFALRPGLSRESVMRTKEICWNIGIDRDEDSELIY